MFRYIKAGRDSKRNLILPLTKGFHDLTAFFLGSTGWSISYRKYIYCKSRNLPDTEAQNCSTDLRQFLGHPVYLLRFF